MKIKVSTLRRAANTLFDHLERTGNAEIDVDKDFYWSIPDEKLYSVYDEPSDFTLGQLSDDIQEIGKIALGQKEPIAYALVWLSSVLRFAGAKIVS